MTRRLLLRVVRDLALIPITAFVVYQAMALLPLGIGGDGKHPPPPSIERQMKVDLGFDHRWTTGFLAPWEKLARGDQIGLSERYDLNDLEALLEGSLRIGLMALVLALLGGGLYALGRLAGGRRLDGTFDLIPTLVYGTPIFILAALFAMHYGVATGDDRSAFEPIAAVVVAIGPAAFLGSVLFDALKAEAARPYLLCVLAKGRSRMGALVLHALPNALPAVLDALPPVATAVLTGSFVVEKFFGLTYFANVYVDSAEHKELALVVVATTTFISILILVSLFTELLRFCVDPRARARALEEEG